MFLEGLKSLRYWLWRGHLSWVDARAQRRLDQLDLQPGNVVLDCGANIGTITGLLLIKGLEVHAFEPNPDAYRMLVRRFRFYRRVHCYPYAVYDQTAKIKLYRHQHTMEDPLKWSTGTSLFAYKSNVDAQAPLMASAIDLASFVQKLPQRVKLIKMDIEGAEYQVLTHLITTGVIAKIDHIVVETHHERDASFRPSYEALTHLMAKHHIHNITFDWF